MTTFTVNVHDKRSEKAIKAFFEALQLPYEVQKTPEVSSSRPLGKNEQELFNRLKNSFSDIKKWEKGELELNDARTFLNGPRSKYSKVGIKKHK